MEHWRESFSEVVIATAPITLLIIFFKLAFLGTDAASLIQVVLGSLMALLGLALFLTGARAGILAFGERLGSRLPQYGSFVLLLVFGVVLGFVVTVAEPDVRVLTKQVELASPGFLPHGHLLLAVAVGVALFVGLSMLKTMLQARLIYILVPGYLLTFLLAALAPPQYLAIAFDSGGVTTGPLTVPFILAFNVGLTTVLGRQGGISDSFGIVALASIGPVAAVLLLGILRGGG